MGTDETAAIPLLSRVKLHDCQRLKVKVILRRLLNGGLERRLYELARKHCGNQEQWIISLELLHKKAGSTAPVWKFRQVLARVIRSNEVPDYRIDYQPETNQVVFVRQ